MNKRKVNWRDGLVQVTVRVHRKGKVFDREQWVRPETKKEKSGGKG